MREKVSIYANIQPWKIRVRHQKSYKIYENSTFSSPCYTFSLAGNILIFTLIQGTNRENYFNHIIYKKKMPTRAGNKHPSVQFSFHRQRLFHLSTEKCTGLIRKKRTSSTYSRVDTINNNINKRSKRFP